MRNPTVSLEELNALLAEEGRVSQPLGRMAMQRWMLFALWGLRFYVVAMLLLFVLRFVQMAGLLG